MDAKEAKLKMLAFFSRFDRKDIFSKEYFKRYKVSTSHGYTAAKYFSYIFGARCSPASRDLRFMVAICQRRIDFRNISRKPSLSLFFSLFSVSRILKRILQGLRRIMIRYRPLSNGL